MGFSREQLLARLQAKHVGHIKGGLIKNLFLEDKKHRFYIVSALADAKVDLKVLSRRLGLGKGGLKPACEEAVAEILQVPLGCVTPFALVNESARHVSLLLDQGFKMQDCCIFLPLSNDMLISLNIQDLETFLKSMGRLLAFVDLEANPPVGKEQPPDLAAVVPSEILADVSKKTVSMQIDGSMNSIPTAATADAIELSGGPQKDNSANTANLSSTSIDPRKFIEEILDKTSALVISVVSQLSGGPLISSTSNDQEKFVEGILDKTSALVLSEISEENIMQHREQLGAVVSSHIRKHLNLEIRNLVTMCKNTAYTEGFRAGIGCGVRHL